MFLLKLSNKTRYTTYCVHSNLLLLNTFSKQWKSNLKKKNCFEFWTRRCKCWLHMSNDSMAEFNATSCQKLPPHLHPFVLQSASVYFQPISVTHHEWSVPAWSNQPVCWQLLKDNVFGNFPHIDLKLHKPKHTRAHRHIHTQKQFLYTNLVMFYLFWGFFSTHSWKI